MYRFLPWIDTDKLNMWSISANPKAIWYLENNIDKINWSGILLNPAALHIISACCPTSEINWNIFAGNKSDDAYDMILPHVHEITNWSKLCTNENPWINKIFAQYPEIIKKLPEKDMFFFLLNPSAMPTIERMDLNDINWKVVSRNENALDFLEMHPTKIDSLALQSNPNPKAYELFTRYQNKYGAPFNLYVAQMRSMVPLLRKIPELIENCICANENPDAYDLILKYVEENYANRTMYQEDWDNLSDNPNAVSILRKYPEHINWNYLCRIHTKEAVELIEEHIDKINWDELSANPEAIHILSSHVDLINWNMLSCNDGIYEPIEVGNLRFPYDPSLSSAKRGL